MKLNIKFLIFLLFLPMALGVFLTACGTDEPGSKQVELHLSAPEMTMALGDSVRLSYTVNPTGSSISWTSTNPDVLTVDHRGFVRTLACGISKVIASSGETADTCIITVKPYLETLRFTGAAIAGEPDTNYFHSGVINATMSGKPVKVYKSLLTLYILSEGLYMNADGELEGVNKGAIIIIESPVYYGPKELNDGKSVGNIVDTYKTASPYKGDVHTFAAATIDEARYLNAFAHYYQNINAGFEDAAYMWLDSAAHAISGARLALVSYSADEAGYIMNNLPSALVTSASFTLNQQGVTATTYGLTKPSFTVRPFEEGSNWGIHASKNAEGEWVVKDQSVYLGAPITY